MCVGGVSEEEKGKINMRIKISGEGMFVREKEDDEQSDVHVGED